MNSLFGVILSMLGTIEIIILIIIGLILFGSGKRIGEIAYTLGKFSAEFKKGKEEVKKEVEKIKEETKT